MGNQCQLCFSYNKTELFKTCRLTVGRVLCSNISAYIFPTRLCKAVSLHLSPSLVILSPSHADTGMPFCQSSGVFLSFHSNVKFIWTVSTPSKAWCVRLDRLYRWRHNAWWHKTYKGLHIYYLTTYTTLLYTETAFFSSFTMLHSTMYLQTSCYLSWSWSPVRQFEQMKVIIISGVDGAD